MKTLRILKRTILTRTGFKKYPYKATDEITVIYNNIEYSNHKTDIKSDKLRVPFYEFLKTRKRSDVLNFINHLGRSEDDRFLKNVLEHIVFFVEGK
jgi:hypothetical protein